MSVWRIVSRGKPIVNAVPCCYNREMISMDNEIYIRLGSFLGVLMVMALFEAASPRRSLRSSKTVRWFTNLSITFIDGFTVRIVFPVMAIDIARIAADRQWGLFNNIDISDAAAGIASVLFLDLVIYAQHAAFHHIRPLWRLHKMHHTDLDIDVTTGSRFHPVEIILSMGIKMSVVTVIGAPAWSVLVFEVLLNATAMFNHSNVYIHPAIDGLLRIFVVTPDMHRVHHSVIIKEYNSNFGFNLPWWDRIFRTYRAQPEKGHTEMNIGLARYRDSKKLTLPWLLAIPFLSEGRFRSE